MNVLALIPFKDIFKALGNYSKCKEKDKIIQIQAKHIEQGEKRELEKDRRIKELEKKKAKLEKMIGKK